MPAKRAIEIIKKIVNSKSKTFMAFCFCFMVGAGAASIFNWFSNAEFILFGVLFFCLFLIIIFWHKKLIRFWLLAVLFIIFGIWRLAITMPNCLSPNQVCYYNQNNVTLVGVVNAEPDIRIGNARYIINVSSVCQNNNCSKSAGNVLITVKLYPQYKYGDKLQINCNLAAPKNSDDSNFNYPKYLASNDVFSTCYPKTVTLLTTGGGNWLFSNIYWLKSKVQSQIDHLWPEPESSFMAGLLYGSKTGLPLELMDNFNKTGVTHIIAVSGYNITIIATVLMTVLIVIGLRRPAAYWAVLAVLFLFVIFTGATGSVVRAAIMGAVVLTAQRIGRLSNVANVLIFTAAVIVLFNPYALVWDAGFQLSFLSTLGLIYISPVLTTAIPGQTLTQTFSAIIATLPLILYQFGRLSIIAPVVNVMILWIIPFLMLFGFIALILSFIFFPLGQLVALIAHFGLQYVLFIVNFFGGQSWSAVSVSVSGWIAVLMYAGIVYVISTRREKILSNS